MRKIKGGLNINSNQENGLSLKKNIIWNSAGNFIYLFTQWIITYSVTRLLGYDNAGVFALGVSFSHTFGTIAAYGIRNYQVSDTNKEFDDNTYIITRIYTSIAAVFVCSVFVLSNNFDKFQVTCIITYMLFRISESLTDVYHGVDQLNMRMDYIGISFIIKGLFTSIVFIFIIWFTKDLLLGILSLVATSYIVLIFYDQRKSARFYVKKRIDIQLIKNLLVKCFPLAFYNFMFTTYTTIPRYFLEKIMGSELLGIYASIALPVIIIQTLAAYIFSPFITIFADSWNNGDYNLFKKLFKKIFAILTILSVTAIIGTLLVGDFGLKLLFGEQILKYSSLLIPLVWCTILTSFLWFISAIIIVIRNLKVLVISGIIAVLICLIGSTNLITMFGLNGASFITIISLSVQIAILFIFSLWKMKIQSKKLKHY